MITLLSSRARRITIPYKDIYTSVFILDTPEGTILFDTAFCNYDVDTYILPELKRRNLRYIFISHNHKDHALGPARLMEIYPDATIVAQDDALAEKFSQFSVLHPQDGDMLLDSFQVISTPGHSADSQSLLDTRTKMLFTGDSLQAYGIFGEGEWGACIRCVPEYLTTLEKLKTLEVDNLVMSHDYHPYGNEVFGTEEIHNCLDICAKALFQVKDVLCAHLELSDQEIADLYNKASNLPIIPAFLVEAIRNTL